MPERRLQRSRRIKKVSSQPFWQADKPYLHAA